MRSTAIANVLAVLCWLCVCALPTSAEQGAPGVSVAAEHRVSFNDQVRPLLSDRCYYCHGPDQQHREADLRLDIREVALADRGGGAAIVPGDPEASLLVQRIAEKDDDVVMPPASSKHDRLTETEVAMLRRWIAQGAEYEPHWAFAPLSKGGPPEVRRADAAVNPIDRFVLAQLERRGVEPAPAADRATLARRVFLDLTGLLPEPEEVAAFEADLRPDAYQRLVDRLLASPHFAERWGRHWLDQARYADSHGYSIDSERTMWPYRDWVIGAIGDDMPFRQFTIEQLAGDLLPDPTTSQRIATGFHRNTLINQEGGTDPEQFRHEAVVDRVNTTASVWLGLTLGCAQCHTHKFDPITHREYYEFFAFFNSGTDTNNEGATVSLAPGEPLGPAAGEPVKVMVMAERAEPRPTYLCVRGDFLRPDKDLGPLDPGGLSFLMPPLPAAPGRNRLDLATWLVDDANPLTPRVTVNRIWMRYFGRGLVETEEDFGTQGTPPSHPALLDWLARYFQEHETSLKSLHRLIVTSNTYRQSSRHRPELADIDPRNVMLARQNRIRVEAEIVRDASLVASGQIDRTIGGPSVHPPQPEGIYSFTQTAKQWVADTGGDRFRRAMYTQFFRSAPYPLFGTFDAPDFQTVCTRRTRSNTPLQALTLANDEAFVELSRYMALRVLRERPDASTSERIERAFRLGLSRTPSEAEMAALTQFHDDLIASFQTSRGEIAAWLGQIGLAEQSSETAAQAAALVAVCRAILNTDNFITRE